MIRIAPILALALAVCAPLPGTATSPGSIAPQRDATGSPRALESRAREAEPEKKAELLRLAAQRWLARGERRRAIRALDEAILARPDDPRLWRERSRLYAAAGAPRTAIYDVTRAIELDAANPAAYRLRATLWRRVGAHDRAAVDLAHAANPPTAATQGTGGQALDPHASRPDLAVADPGTLEAPALAVARPPAMPAIAAPRSLLPATPAHAAGTPPRGRDDLAARPARSALLASPALDDVTLTAARRQATAVPVPAQFASSQPLFPTPDRRGGLPAAPDPIEAHRRRMDAAAIVERRLEAGDAMTATMMAAPASGSPDPSFRASTAPLPRIYRGTQMPAQMASRMVVPRGAQNVGGGGGGTGGIGGPLLPVRKAMPASFDATPADAMVERGVALPVVKVERGALR